MSFIKRLLSAMSDSSPAFHRKPTTNPWIRRGRILTIIGGSILLIMWIPVFAGTPGDPWISTVGLITALVGIGCSIKGGVLTKPNDRS